MLKFHNVSAYLANLHGNFSRKDAKLAKEKPRISRIDTNLFSLTTDYGQQTTDFPSEKRKDSCKFAGYAKLFCVLCYLFCRFATFARGKDTRDSRDTWRRRKNHYLCIGNPGVRVRIRRRFPSLMKTRCGMLRQRFEES